MSHLKKAKAALDAAKDAGAGGTEFTQLLRIAEVQAQVAQAEALTELAFTFTEYAKGRLP